MHDFAALFQHRFLVFANRHARRMESRNIGSLADRIAEEAQRYAGIKVLLFDFGLDGRVALHAGYRDKIHIISRQFKKCRHQGLYKNRSFFGVDSYTQIIECYLQYVLTYFFRILGIISQCLSIGNHKVNLIKFSGVLQGNAVSQRTDIMTYMEMTRRTIPRKNNLFHVNNSSLRLRTSNFRAKFSYLLIYYDFEFL